MELRKVGIVAVASGMLLAGIGGVGLLGVEQERSISSLGDVAFLDNCELETLGKLFDFTPRYSTFGEKVDCDAPDPLDVKAQNFSILLWIGAGIALIGGLLVLFREKLEEMGRNRKATAALKDLPAGPSNTLTEKLRELESLRAEGLISEQEFKDKRKRILEES